VFKQCFENHCKSRRHLDEPKEKEPIQYHCTKCNYTTAFKHCFENHCKSKRHDEPKEKEQVQYHCTKCNYTTAFKHCFENHCKSQAHQLEKPLFCEFCNYMTKRTSCFEQHMESSKHYATKVRVVAQKKQEMFDLTYPIWIAYHQAIDRGEIPPEPSDLDRKRITYGFGPHENRLDWDTPPEH